jgi:hypothetical protein
MALTHTKKVYIRLFIKARIRPKRSGSARIRIHNTANLLIEDLISTTVSRDIVPLNIISCVKFCPVSSLLFKIH